MTAPQRAGHRPAASAAKSDPKHGQKLPPRQGAKAETKSTAHPETVSRRVEKSAAAFRTISEVAEELDVPQHVLRFWESKFPQVRPLKRGGGRRYYRPEDVDLLSRIRQLLYADGYTIKGVQRLMREGALKAKRDGGHGDAGEGQAEAVQAGAPAEAEEGAGPLRGEVRAELEGLLDEFLVLREDLRRFAG